MSAFGQKRTLRAVRPMSASAHVRFGPCPLYPRKRTFLGAIWMSAKCEKQTFAKMTQAKKKDRLAAVSPKPNRMFGSGGCALGFFDLEVASDSIEHGHLSLLDRCDGIVDGERSVFVQQVGIICSAFNAQIVLPLGYFRL